MRKTWLASLATLLILLVTSGPVPVRAQQMHGRPGPVSPGELTIEHPECSYFGPGADKFVPQIGAESRPGSLTRQFAAMAATHRDPKSHDRPFQTQAGAGANLIDQFINADLQSNNITPADKTDDYEFLRRVSLDLTGRIPKGTQVTAFAGSTAPNKRAALVEELLASPEWTDKWTMYYGDLFMNTAATVQVNRRPEGRNAFYKWIHDSLSAAKPYDQMATELIAAQGNNSFDQSNGQMNWLAGAYVNGGPAQDVFDSQAAATANTFLGITHVNCLLCHSGRGHLDSLSLWGSQTTRVQAWGLASFFSHTNTMRVSTPPDPNKNTVVQYWSLGKYTTDYTLNTTTGNRPARVPIGNAKTIPPTYPWGGNTPGKGEDYRASLAGFVTNDFQFARASVNYIWAQFFGRGIVDPPDQFDPLRLDPDNPPPAPWVLQPSNARLLNALAQDFIDKKYDVRALMRLIVNSDTYQLTSQYNGTWDPKWEPYFARKLVRRLWAEEIHDAVVAATGMTPNYTVPGFTNDSTVYGVTSPGFGKIQWAMQAPDVVNMPDGGAVSQFLDAFLRGNRDDQPRKGEGSILQALGLMNDNFISSRIHATGSGASASFLQTLVNLPDVQLIDTLYLTVLSRHPNSAELLTSQSYLEGAGTRKANAEDLLWSLFNKVDFVFNY